MANDRSRKISELTSLAANAIANNDVFVIVDTSASETKKVAANSVATYLFKTPLVPGPYTDDATAAAGGVSVGGLYYRASGLVYVRLV